MGSFLYKRFLTCIQLFGREVHKKYQIMSFIPTVCGLFFFFWSRTVQFSAGDEYFKIYPKHLMGPHGLLRTKIILFPEKPGGAPLLLSTNTLKWLKTVLPLLNKLSSVGSFCNTFCIFSLLQSIYLLRPLTCAWTSSSVWYAS